jgi:hypothetical protein
LLLSLVASLFFRFVISFSTAEQIANESDPTPTQHPRFCPGPDPDERGAAISAADSKIQTISAHCNSPIKFNVKSFRTAK